MSDIKVISVNLSEERGPKYPVEEIKVEKYGVQGDVHAKPWNRQISLIDTYHIEKFQTITECRDAKFGEFAENITISGLGNIQITPFDKFRIGSVLLEVTQVGKPFHNEFKELGNYVMPRVGIFCRVLETGTIAAGDKIEFIPKVFKAHVITLSDRASKGEYSDRSGPEISSMLKPLFEKHKLRFEIENVIIPDDEEKLTEHVNRFVSDKADVLITTGGTGIGLRDITVDVIQPLLDKEIPGIMEMIRLKYGAEKPNALLSRGVAGVKEQTLIYTLPGSVKAVREYMTEILKTLHHLIYMLHGVDIH